MHRILPVFILLPVALSGCLSGLLGEEPPTFEDPLDKHTFVLPDNITGPLPASAIQWPDFSGNGTPAELHILDHGAFAAFDTAAAIFENLTGAKVIHTEAADTGDALNQAIADKDDPQFDVLYGIDNALWSKAMEAELYHAYTPKLAPRVGDFVFFKNEEWPATPVDHGWIALNVDAANLDEPVTTLHDVARHAGDFVTQDPRTSTPGLGFLLTTIGRFGESGATSWKQYWNQLFLGPDGVENSGDEVLITSDWSTAYETHFTGGYGIWTDGHVGDRAIVTSYTESPAYEWYWDEIYPRNTGEYEPGGHYGGDPANLPKVLLDSQGSVWHQIQTMGILQGTDNLAVAQAWIEFTLTDDFQALAASENAVYPVGPVNVNDIYSGLDPRPNTFQTVEMDHTEVGSKLDRWIDEWVELCEQYDCI